MVSLIIPKTPSDERFQDTPAKSNMDFRKFRQVERQTKIQDRNMSNEYARSHLLTY